jgi:hypothetical protein
MQYAPAPTSIIFVWGQKLFIVRDGRGGISTLMLMYCHLPLLVLRRPLTPRRLQLYSTAQQRHHPTAKNRMS